jgi:hypothetical protein
VAPNTDSDRTFGTSHQPNLRRIDRCRVLDSCDNPVRHQENEVLPQRRSSSAIGSLRCDRRREVSCDPTMAARMSPMRNSRPAFENMKAWRSKESRLLAIRGRSDTGRFCDSTRACNDQQTPTFSAASSRAEWLGQRRPQLPHFVGPSDRGLNQGKLRDRVDADALAGIAEKGELPSPVVMPRVWKKRVSKARSAYPLSSRPCAGPPRRARPELMNCVFRFNGAPRMIEVDRGVMR